MRRLERDIALWLGAGALTLASVTVAYAFARRTGGVLAARPQLALGIYLGAMAAVIYGFSLRKWALIFLYRTSIFRPKEIEQDAATRARAEIEDLQRVVDAGLLTDKGEIRAKAREVLARYRVDRALRVDLEPRQGAPGPRIELGRREVFGKLEQWLYGHAVFGAVAIAGALYHADFRLGGPVSAALLLSFLGAALTGIWGGYLYWVVPARLSAAEAKLGYQETRAQIERLEEELAAAAGKGEHAPKAEKGEKEKAAEKADPELAAVLPLMRARVLDHYRPQEQRKRLLELWLYAHIPLATAALGLLVVHVLSIWWY